MCASRKKILFILGGMGGMGEHILSTSKDILSGKEAECIVVGGELSIIFYR
jgi:ribosomal protein S8